MGRGGGGGEVVGKRSGGLTEAARQAFFLVPLRDALSLLNVQITE